MALATLLVLCLVFPASAVTIATTGLGSLNLTTGSQDAFLLGVNSCNQSVNVTITVYSSGATTKTATIVVPAGTTPNYVQIPFSTFTGTGNFTSVGAIQLVVNSSPGASLVLDFLRTSSTASPPLVEATLTDVVLVDNDGNGKASAGDPLRYIVRINNNDVVAKPGVNFSAPTPANTTLGAVSTTPIARNDGPPSASSTPGQAFHGSFNTTLNIPAAAGLLTNDFVGSPAALVTFFGGGSLGGPITDNAAGTSAAASGNTLTVNADGSLTFVPSSTFVGNFTFSYRIANSGAVRTLR